MPVIAYSYYKCSAKDAVLHMGTVRRVLRIAVGYGAVAREVLVQGRRSPDTHWQEFVLGNAPHSQIHFTMNINPLFLMVPLLFAGCAVQRVEHPLAHEVRNTSVPPDIFRIEDRDAQMHQAVLKARRNVGVFIVALQNPTKGQHDFEVKKPFVKDGEVEHIWLSHVQFSGNRFHGLVDNHPKKIKGLKFGDRVSVNPNEISDWAFVDNGKLVGGYTIRVLVRNLSSEQKKDFENESQFRIDPH